MMMRQASIKKIDLCHYCERKAEYQASYYFTVALLLTVDKIRLTCVKHRKTVFSEKWREM